MSIVDSLFEKLFPPTPEDLRQRRTDAEIAIVEARCKLLELQADQMRRRIERLEKRQEERDAGGPFR